MCGRVVEGVRGRRTGVTRRAARDGVEMYAVGERSFLRVHAEDVLATLHSGQGDGDLAIETARTQQRGIEHIGPVGGGDDDDAFLGVEAVHLHQQLMERLLAFVVSAANAVAAAATDRV